MRGEGSEGSKAFDADVGVGAFFGGGREDGAEGYVVDWLICGRLHLGWVVGGVADDCAGADDGSGICGKEVFLAEVKASIEEAGVVGAVIDDEEGVRFAAEVGDLGGEVEGGAIPEVFVADLEDLSAAFKEGFGGIEGRAIAVGERRGVEDWVDAR